MSATVIQGGKKTKTKDGLFGFLLGRSTEHLNSCDSPILHITSASFEAPPECDGGIPRGNLHPVETLLPTSHLLVNPDAVINRRAPRRDVNGG